MQPHVASEYATQEAPLHAQVQSLLAEASPIDLDFRVSAIVVPDANLVQGGPVSADVYAAIRDLDVETVIVIAPSPRHIQDFRRIGICSLDDYRSPLGSVAVDEKVRNELCDEDDDIFIDDTGHFHQTGMDVQLPFLQSVLSDFKVVPLVMGSESLDFCKELGNAVGEIMFNRPTLVVACADIESATEDGLKAFRKALESLDVDALHRVLNRESDIVVRGKGAVLTAVMATVHRRANAVRIANLHAPDSERPGFAGVLIGRR
ncbi:MAG: AmmeMemoRadiSam system protein B [Rhodothermales bacterium]